MNPRAGFITTALGWPMPTGRISIEEELHIHGLHPRDRRLKFAATALRASRPKAWPKILAAFGHKPTPVPLPAPSYPIDHDAFDGAKRDIVTAMQSSARMNRTATPAGGWAILSGALLLWLSREPALNADDILTLTSVLQSLGDRHIERIDSALFFALTAHTEWRAAAVMFLTPYRETWAADWLAALPEY